jgi:hypothetical protein
MKTVSSRDLKNNPGILADSDVTIVYSRSKPMAVCVSVSEGEDVLSLADAMLQMRAQRALELARIMAREGGTDRIPDSEIDAEIRSLRVAQKKD